MIAHEVERPTMMIEYEDLLEQLQSFRCEVIKALAEIDVDLEALRRAQAKGRPLLAEDLNRIRDNSRQMQRKFEEQWERRLPLLHERRSGE